MDYIHFDKYSDKLHKARTPALKHVVDSSKETQLVFFQIFTKLLQKHKLTMNRERLTSSQLKDV